MISLSLPLAPKLKVITSHFISYRRKSVDNLVEIQNIYEDKIKLPRTFVRRRYIYEGIFWISDSCGHPEGKIFRFVRLVAKIFR